MAVVAILGFVAELSRSNLLVNVVYLTEEVVNVNLPAFHQAIGESIGEMRFNQKECFFGQIVFTSHVY